MWISIFNLVLVGGGCWQRRLVALVPRRHLVTYHGVLAPAAGLRSRIVPEVEEESERAGCR